MKIYSGNGDAGFTLDINGQKISKNDDRLHLLGTLDELMAHLGLVKAMLQNEDAWQFSWKSACNFIEKIQKNLMKIMTDVSGAAQNIKEEKKTITDIELNVIEKEIDRLSANIPRQKGLIIPGKNIIEAQIQISRTISRRAERLFFAVKGNTSLCSNTGAYLNRLSDYLFILSQQESLINVNFINQITGI